MFGENLNTDQRMKWLREHTMLLIGGGTLRDEPVRVNPNDPLTQPWSFVVTISQDKLAEGVHPNHPFGYQFFIGGDVFEEVASRAYATAYGLINKGLGFMPSMPND